jgi:hypothetical protein
MTYYGTIPEAPDIRKQRPGYFDKGQTDFDQGFTMPQGMQPFNPAADQWENTVPDLWPEIKQNLRQIMKEAREPYLVGTTENPLTADQEAMQKTRMAWQSPSGLQAIEIGKHREQQARYVEIDRAEKRVATLEKHLMNLSKIDGVPKGLLIQAERRYNSAVKGLDTQLGKGKESGYPLFAGDGKMTIQGVEKEEGWMSKTAGAVKDWVIGDSQGGPGTLRGQESPLGPSPDIEVMEPGAGSPVSAVGDVAGQTLEQAGGVFVKALLSLDQMFVEKFGSKKAKELTDKIVKDNPATGEEGVPIARIEQAIAALPADARKSPAVLQMQRQITARKLSQPGATKMEPRMPILERFQQGLPTNEEYIAGGGMPGMIGRKLMGRPAVQRGE